ncbi:MAG: thiamine phosphate synthase [Chloroflexi bacterium]|nr:thiamine phosphate synthase [Chloroflexota bacterium]
MAAALRALAGGDRGSGRRERVLSQDEAASLAAAFSRYVDVLGHAASGQEAEGRWLGLRKALGEAALGLAAPARRTATARLAGLYVIVDPDHTAGRDVLEIARAALQGGATAIQWRDKRHDKGEQLPLASRLGELCRQHQATFVVNDHADLAVACGADGLHVGQRDLPVDQARRILHPWQLVGASNALVSEAEASARAGADYVAVGSMFPTPSKAGTRLAGLETLREVRRRLPQVTLVAIGGVTLENVSQVLEAGADGVCVMSAVCSAPDPEAAARRLMERVRSRKEA